MRWTIGAVSRQGFEALRLSIHGALRIFGADARYAVCVNGLGIAEAQQRTGPVPACVQWHRSGGLPSFMRSHLEDGMAEGAAWKLAPLRLFPDRHEIALDNDCILWDRPIAMQQWLQQEARCLIAADLVLAHGAFTHLTGPQPRNAGIRGFPPGFDLDHALRQVLAMHPIPIRSEQDEQGLQVAALDLAAPAYVVACEDVWLCSPFWPKAPHLGRCGAHFIGLNITSAPWSYFGRPATEVLAANWFGHRRTLYARVGLQEPDDLQPSEHAA